MEGQPPASVERTNRVRQWFANLSFSQMGRLLVLAALAATAAFGGLDTVDKGVTPFAPGEEFSDGEFTLTIERARLIPDVKSGSRTIASAQPGKIYLGVVATLRNDGTVPGRLRNEFDLRDPTNYEFFGAFRFRDGSAIQELGPGLTEQLAFLWLLPDSARRTVHEVTIRVWKKVFKQLMVSYGGKTWLESPTDYGQVVMPVKEGA
jgi:hypothetical protein